MPERAEKRGFRHIGQKISVGLRRSSADRRRSSESGILEQCRRALQQ
jgi:hypothetical protein